jgi:hypothetical protein
MVAAQRVAAVVLSRRVRLLRVEVNDGGAVLVLDIQSAIAVAVFVSFVPGG